MKGQVSMVTQDNYTPNEQKSNKLVQGDKESNQKQLISLIKSISGQANILTIPRLYIDILDGDVKAALLLSQIVYWSDKSKRTDGWFWKSFKEWNDELGLTQKVVVRAVSVLKDLGLIETKVKRAMGAPTTHYKVNLQLLTNLIIAKGDNGLTPKGLIDYAQREQSDYTQREQSLTETTHLKTTTKSTTTTREGETGEPGKQEPDLSLSLSSPFFKTLKAIPLNKELTQEHFDYWQSYSKDHSEEKVIGFLEWCADQGFSWSKAREVEKKRQKVKDWEVTKKPPSTSTSTNGRDRSYYRFVDLVKRKGKWVEVYETMQGDKFNRYVWDEQGSYFKEFNPDGSPGNNDYDSRYPKGRIAEGDEFYDYGITYTPGGDEVKLKYYTKPDGFRYLVVEDTGLTFEEVET